MENDSYFFSIVIPIYNAEKYVEIMINSIIEQSFSNWELILVDDGSTDNSFDICKKYIRSNISLYHYDNGGQTFARKAGIMKAKGKYTIVVDADDSLVSSYLMSVYNILNAEEFDAVMFPILCCDEKLVPIKKSNEGTMTSGKKKQTEIIEWIINTHNHSLCNKVFRTSILRAALDTIPDKRVSVNGDYLMVIPVMCHVKSIYYIDEPFYLYRVYGSSISHKYSMKHIEDSDYVSQIITDCLEKCGIINDVLLLKVNIAYLKMISQRLKQLIYQKRITRSDIVYLNTLTFYKNSKKYETIQHIGYDDWKIMSKLREGDKCNLNILRLNIIVKKYERRIRNIFR